MLRSHRTATLAALVLAYAPHLAHCAAATHGRQQPTHDRRALAPKRGAPPAPPPPAIDGRQLHVDGKPFDVKGVCYSPTPINSSVYFAPYGDYFTAEYSFIWLRDLPLIKAMGATMLRVYGWLPENDHSAFLDAVEAHGLKLMATFYMGDATESPVATKHQRSEVIAKFAQQVRQYAAHPALLIWSFGNELNGVWNGYLQQLGHDPDEGPCAWDDRYDDKGGCWIHKGTLPNKTSPCFNSTFCVYSRLFRFIEAAAVAAKREADVIVVSAFADVDGLYDKVARAGYFAPTVDAWTAQVYRGNTFGDFFDMMNNASDKPILITEYGVDAYSDTCGTGTQSPCFNMLGDESGSFEDELSQSNYAVNLTNEILREASSPAHCKHAKRGAVACSTLGGFLMSWVDEYWKGSKSQAHCDPTYNDPAFTVATCDDKAHVTCGNWNASQHDLCGYQLDAAPDHYVNEEWFGITTPTNCGHDLNALRPRRIYWEVRNLWRAAAAEDVEGGAGGSATTTTTTTHPRPTFPDCEQTFAVKCMPEDSVELEFVRGSRHAPCSGRGSCTADHKRCGSGDTNLTVTPCCLCEMWFAGPSCEALDARVYLGLCAAALLVLLLLLQALLVTTSTVAGCFRAGSRDADFKGDLRQPLVSR